MIMTHGDPFVHQADAAYEDSWTYYSVFIWSQCPVRFLLIHVGIYCINILPDVLINLTLSRISCMKSLFKCLFPSVICRIFTSINFKPSQDQVNKRGWSPYAWHGGTILGSWHRFLFCFITLPMRPYPFR